MYHPSRGGVRGGAADFSWDQVRQDKDREFYLGHSVVVPTGRWQNGRDVTWYTKEKAGDDDQDEKQRKRREELMEIKRKEEEAMYQKLGIKPGILPSSGPTVGSALVGGSAIGSGTGANTAPLASGSRWGGGATSGAAAAADGEPPLTKEERRIAKKLAKMETRALRKEAKERRKEERHREKARMADEAASSLHRCIIGRRVVVQVRDGRAFQGTFACVDRDVNVILSMAEELRRTQSAAASADPSVAAADDAGRQGGDGGGRREEGDDHAMPPGTAATIVRRPVGMVMIAGDDLVGVQVQTDADLVGSNASDGTGGREGGFGAVVAPPPPRPPPPPTSSLLASSPTLARAVGPIGQVTSEPGPSAPIPAPPRLTDIAFESRAGPTGPPSARESDVYDGMYL